MPFRAVTLRMNCDATWENTSKETKYKQTEKRRKRMQVLFVLFFGLVLVWIWFYGCILSCCPYIQRIPTLACILKVFRPLFLNAAYVDSTRLRCFLYLLVSWSEFSSVVIPWALRATGLLPRQKNPREKKKSKTKAQLFFMHTSRRGRNSYIWSHLHE